MKVCDDNKCIMSEWVDNFEFIGLSLSHKPFALLDGSPGDFWWYVVGYNQNWNNGKSPAFRTANNLSKEDLASSGLIPATDGYGYPSQRTKLFVYVDLQAEAFCHKMDFSDGNCYV